MKFPWKLKTQDQFQITNAHREEVEKFATEWLKPSQQLRYLCCQQEEWDYHIGAGFLGSQCSSHVDKYSLKYVSECIGNIGGSLPWTALWPDFDSYSTQSLNPTLPWPLPGRGQLKLARIFSENLFINSVLSVWNQPSNNGISEWRETAVHSVAYLTFMAIK